MHHSRHNRPELAPIVRMPVRVKGSGPEIVSANLLKRQVEIARECLVPVDLSLDRGTCSDERKRIGLLNGSSVVKPRPSVLGGPDLYALAVMELTGAFAPNDNRSSEQRLSASAQKLQDAGLRNGGHLICKFNADWLEWLSAIANHPEYIADYTRQEKGDDYVEEAMAEVIAEAQAIVSGGLYKDWDESVLPRVLGADAGEAIEQLAPVQHKGLIVVRNRIINTTVDQNELYDRSVIGEGGYVIDDWYADTLEHVAASGPDADWKMTKAGHAHEAIIAAMVKVLPNPELYVAVFSK
ncbi:MAG TPA: hypothetical protein VMR95_03425 [Candidatus Binatia bacterium]|nr:hypothetical protein [Candidatus Binatia bacterium]